MVRRILAGLLVLSGLWSLAACSTQGGGVTPASPSKETSLPAVPVQPSPAVPTTEAKRVPKPAGELRIAVESLQTESLDPTKNGNAARFFLSLLYDNVAGLDASARLNLNNGLAEKWETSADGKTHTVYLRKGVKFHSGEEVTAEDVKYSLERYGRPESMTGGSAWKKLLGDVQVIDPHKLMIQSPNPDYMFPYDASAGALGFVLPKNYISEKGEDYFAKHPLGSGPYKFVEQVNGSYLKFEANESYWRMVPKWKTVTFLIVPEEATRITMLKRGEADVISMSLDRVKEVKDLGLDVIRRKGDGLIGLMFTEQYRPDSVTSDVRIRQALSLAINNQAIMDSFFAGYSTPAKSYPQASYAFGYDKEWQNTYDPEKAKKLLSDAGYPNAFKNPEIRLMSVPSVRVPNNQLIAQVIATQWQQVGVKVSIVPMDLAVWREQLTKQTHGRSTATLYPLDNSAGPDMGKVRFMYDSKGVGRWVGDTRPELDALITKADAAQTESDRDEAMRKISRYVNENYISIAMIEVDLVFGTRGQSWDTGKISNDFGIELVPAE